MKALLTLPIAVLASWPVQAGDKSDSPPIAVSQPEPQYPPELTKYYLLSPLHLTLVIDDRGIPFSVSSTSAIPDNIVSAVAQWRYQPGKKNGASVPFSVNMTYPVRTLLDASRERSLVRRPFVAGKVGAAMESGTGLDAEAADKLERSLEADLTDYDARGKLLVYSTEIAATNPKDAADRRARHIQFLVQNSPEDLLLESPFAFINTTAGPLPDPQAYSRIRDLWLQQVSLNPNDEVILEHATNFLRISDRDKTQELLLANRGIGSDVGIWFGDLYGLWLLGVNGLDLRTGLAVSAGPSIEDSAVTQRIRRSLIAPTTDTAILLSALNTYMTHGRALARMGKLPTGYGPVCEQLLARAKQVYPDTSSSCDPAAAVPNDVARVGPGLPQRIRVGGNVQQAHLIKKVTPLYPPDAKGRGIQGVVKFVVIIGKDGSIANLSLVSAPLALYKAAHDAVQQWVYKPTTLNGNPVEVVTTIEVNFTLSR
jgi:TonB family protein